MAKLKKAPDAPPTMRTAAPGVGNTPPPTRGPAQLGPGALIQAPMSGSVALPAGSTSGSAAQSKAFFPVASVKASGAVTKSNQNSPGSIAVSKSKAKSPGGLALPEFLNPNRTFNKDRHQQQPVVEGPKGSLAKALYSDQQAKAQSQV